MIKPTIGRVVWFWDKPPIGPNDQPKAAKIAYVHGDRRVNLAVFGRDGNLFCRCNVQLMQGDEKYTPVTEYCEWPLITGTVKAVVRGPDVVDTEFDPDKVAELIGAMAPKPLDPDSLRAERLRGMAAAAAFCEHLKAMGSAACTIPLIFDGQEYVVKAYPIMVSGEPGERPKRQLVATATPKTEPEKQLEHQFRGKPWPPTHVEVRCASRAGEIWMPAVVREHHTAMHSLGVEFSNGEKDFVQVGDWRHQVISPVDDRPLYKQETSKTAMERVPGLTVFEGKQTKDCIAAVCTMVDTIPGYRLQQVIMDHFSLVIFLYRRVD